MVHGNRHRDRKGFTIIELLIAIIIIGILVAVIIPVLLNRTEEARVAAAESDIEHIRGALERSAIDTGYLFRVYVLDDRIGGNNIFNPYDPGDLDGVRDEQLNSVELFPTRMFIDIKTGQFLASYASIYARLTRNETSFGWNGPYINLHRFRDADFDDLPEDPWGEEYLVFSPAGWINQVAGTIETAYFYFAEDIGTTTVLFIPFFDRFTVLSLGPNNAPGDGSSFAVFGTDDDIFQQFN